MFLTYSNFRESVKHSGMASMSGSHQNTTERSAEPILPPPLQKIAETTQQGQNRVLFSLSWQGWVQMAGILLGVSAAYYSLKGDVEKDSMRITNNERQIAEIQATHDRDQVRAETLAQSANDKLDRVRSSLDKLIGRLDIGNHSSDPPGPAALNSISQHSGLISAAWIENQTKAVREYARRFPKSGESNYVTPSAATRSSHTNGAD
jgi:hypothetical protein